MGRKKTYERTINDILKANEKHIPAIFDALIAAAKKTIKVKCPHCNTKFDTPGGGNIDAMKTLLDRFYGKATQKFEGDIRTVTLSGDTLASIYLAAKQAQDTLLANRSTDVLVVENDGLDSDSTASET